MAKDDLINPLSGKSNLTGKEKIQSKVAYCKELRFRLTEPQKNDLVLMAKEKALSQSQLVRNLIANEVKKHLEQSKERIR